MSIIDDKRLRIDAEAEAFLSKADDLAMMRSARTVQSLYPIVTAGRSGSLNPSLGVAYGQPAFAVRERSRFRPFATMGRVVGWTAFGIGFYLTAIALIAIATNIVEL